MPRALRGFLKKILVWPIMWTCEDNKLPDETTPKAYIVHRSPPTAGPPNGRPLAFSCRSNLKSYGRYHKKEAWKLDHNEAQMPKSTIRGLRLARNCGLKYHVIQSKLWGAGPVRRLLTVNFLAPLYPDRLSWRTHYALPPSVPSASHRLLCLKRVLKALSQPFSTAPGNGFSRVMGRPQSRQARVHVAPLETLNGGCPIPRFQPGSLDGNSGLLLPSSRMHSSMILGLLSQISSTRLPQAPNPNPTQTQALPWQPSRRWPKKTSLIRFRLGTSCGARIAALLSGQDQLSQIMGEDEHLVDLRDDGHATRLLFQEPADDKLLPYCLILFVRQAGEDQGHITTIQHGNSKNHLVMPRA
ncbi:hypothetical protein BGW80DRAFT_1254132 [Lactifluus volemus]|nr:hypothetical protein BGW80DRAFT_1254132 [Lactifluus volemus]